MNLTTQQWTKLTQLSTTIEQVKPDGTSDYQQVVTAITKPILTAIANQVNQPVNELVWAIIRYITDNAEISQAEQELISGF